jgi:hypothetical protein
MMHMTTGKKASLRPLCANICGEAANHDRALLRRSEEELREENRIWAILELKGSDAMTEPELKKRTAQRFKMSEEHAGEIIARLRKNYNLQIKSGR